MNQALLKDTRRTGRACAAETPEFVVATVSQAFAAFALLRWENEGGSPLFCPVWNLRPDRCSAPPVRSNGRSQSATRVNDEFDRVAKSFRSIAHRQDARKRSDTEAILAILEDKRAEVMSGDQAGYFIRDWQEISDQVRQMIGQGFPVPSDKG